VRWNKLDGHLEYFHTLHKRWLPMAHPVLGSLLNLKRPPLLVGRWYGTGRIGADGEEYLEDEDVRHLASMRAAEGKPPLSRQVALLLLCCCFTADVLVLYCWFTAALLQEWVGEYRRLREVYASHSDSEDDYRHLVKQQ
jgi:hypothetical protein